MSDWNPYLSKKLEPKSATFERLNLREVVPDNWNVQIKFCADACLSQKQLRRMKRIARVNRRWMKRYGIHLCTYHADEDRIDMNLQPE